ncbi:hypothetical protein D623_10019880 [Myotis brandtii]|uniref:Uncharacterized protein n=1 Tax=Myotis brandtii TaxID=109478 RepID=S7NQM7_MYOBR|nr:hypothetical protein D623_10019880 [Myotis brandtii]
MPMHVGKPRVRPWVTTAASRTTQAQQPSARSRAGGILCWERCHGLAATATSAWAAWGGRGQNEAASLPGSPATFPGWLTPSLLPPHQVSEEHHPLGGGQGPTRWSWHRLSPTSQSQPGRRSWQVRDQWDPAGFLHTNSLSQRHINSEFLSALRAKVSKLVPGAAKECTEHFTRAPASESPTRLLLERAMARSPAPQHAEQ